MSGYPVYLAINGELPAAVEITPDLSIEEVRTVLLAAAGLNDSVGRVLRLVRPSDGVLLAVGPHLAANTPDTRYYLEIKQDAFVPQTMDRAMSAVNVLLAQVSLLKEKVATSASQVESSTETQDDEILPAKRRIKGKPITAPLTHRIFDTSVTEELKNPTFDIWKWEEPEMADLLIHMFTEFGLIEHFKISETVLGQFLECVRSSYNINPFHNFRHCFCVTQMMYGLLHVTNVKDKLTPLEKLTLLVACIGHDLDHPGFNNAYQVNAATELSLLYNDMSPLENHHAAVLFTILKMPETNVLGSLSDADYKEARKQIIGCILATDMAKHGELMLKFKGFAEGPNGFNFDDPAHRTLLLQMITKCADISNEVRPKHVSEPWVDNLLEEFFTQSDREKAEGLPFAPFMDRQKVTKSGAQVGFIGFVMIPLFELVGKVLPNMEEPVIQPIRKALEYYKSLA
ncbi:High affinity cAMP-specific and IBMX-insensitive 3',5'-cyclic phosphodiesterase 9A [Thoreauomyces humboldtii]|nr:High affinity cAMP-specific and IBMX-insensitive 3',5'-cyclic phosphodiesterase 9A [Thoreauomyces humboldtii]